MRNDPPIRTGGPNDPVAQSIRSDQMMDAAPSPEEIREDHERRLRTEGCTVCDESDPDNLREVRPHYPKCSWLQVPERADFEVFCHEHYRDPEELYRAKKFQQARESDAEAILWYECGRAVHVTDSRETDVPPQHRPPVEIPIECHCGSGIDEVCYL